MNPQTPTQLNRLTIAQTLDGLAAGDFSAREVTQACLKAIDSKRSLNCFITGTPDIALEMADASDKKRHSSQHNSSHTGLMDGVPIGLKDLFCTKNVETTAGSKILKGFIPPYESSVSRKLLNQGAIMLGKLNLDEFAMGSANLTSHFGPVRSPWHPKDQPDTELVPGGSSGGSASAVASHLVIAATGTDTGGSIRQPASFTGSVGIKPTYGRCSRWGIIAFASSLDQAGPITKTVEDAAIMLQAMAGHDPGDSTSANLEVENFRDSLTKDIKGKVIGIPVEYKLGGLSAEIEALWQQGIAWLEEAGAKIRSISLPHTKYALPAYYVIAPAEASSNLARYDGVRFGLRAVAEGDSLDRMYMRSRGEGFGEEVKRRIMIGTHVLSSGFYDAYYNKARQVRTLVARDFSQACQDGIDAILTPTCPTPAFETSRAPDDPVTMYLNDIFTVPVNLAGLPAISIPASLNREGLPLGLQLIGRPFAEGDLLNIAFHLERAANFNTTAPLSA